MPAKHNEPLTQWLLAVNHDLKNGKQLMLRPHSRFASKGQQSKSDMKISWPKKKVCWAHAGWNTLPSIVTLPVTPDVPWIPWASASLGALHLPAWDCHSRFPGGRSLICICFRWDLSRISLETKGKCPMIWHMFFSEEIMGMQNHFSMIMNFRSPPKKW